MLDPRMNQEVGWRGWGLNEGKGHWKAASGRMWDGLFGWTFLFPPMVQREVTVEHTQLSETRFNGKNTRKQTQRRCLLWHVVKKKKLGHNKERGGFLISGPSCRKIKFRASGGRIRSAAARLEAGLWKHYNSKHGRMWNIPESSSYRLSRLLVPVRSGNSVRSAAPFKDLRGKQSSTWEMRLTGS